MSFRNICEPCHAGLPCRDHPTDEDDGDSPATERPARLPAYARLGKACENCGLVANLRPWEGTQREPMLVCDDCHDTLEMEE